MHPNALLLPPVNICKPCLGVLIDVCTTAPASTTPVTNAEWRSEPVLIEFKSAQSPAVSLALNLHGIDSDPRLVYDSPALEIIVEDVSGAAIDQEETYFTVQSDDYHRDAVELGDVLKPHCSLTEWTFDRAVPADEESLILWFSSSQATRHVPGLKSP